MCIPAQKLSFNALQVAGGGGSWYPPPEGQLKRRTNPHRPWGTRRGRTARGYMQNEPSARSHPSEGNLPSPATSPAHCCPCSCGQSPSALLNPTTKLFQGAIKITAIALGWEPDDSSAVATHP